MQDKIIKKGNAAAIDERDDSGGSESSLDSHIALGTDKEKNKGVLKKDNLTVFSTDFFSYVQHNPILFSHSFHYL